METAIANMWCASVAILAQALGLPSVVAPPLGGHGPVARVAACSLQAVTRRTGSTSSSSASPPCGGARSSLGLRGPFPAARVAACYCRR